jgi:hypothetical protein
MRRIPAVDKQQDCGSLPRQMKTRAGQPKKKNEWFFSHPIKKSKMLSRFLLASGISILLNWK